MYRYDASLATAVLLASTVLAAAAVSFTGSVQVSQRHTSTRQRLPLGTCFLSAVFDVGCAGGDVDVAVVVVVVVVACRTCITQDVFRSVNVAF